MKIRKNRENKKGKRKEGKKIKEKGRGEGEK